MQGNFIGTDITGTVGLWNATGLEIYGNNNTIGGTQAEARNIISDTGTVIWLNGSGNLVQGNLIGTKIDGVSPLRNLRGIVVAGVSTSNNAIGGSTASAGNTIAYTNDIGIENHGGLGNAVLSNSIFSNLALGHDLLIGSNGGVTVNDPGDADTGPNNFQNFPVLTSFNSSGGFTTINGTLNSTANTAFTLQFFQNSICDATAYGEGERFIGSAQVTTDVSGDASFSQTFPVSIPPDQFVTATATDPANNTSEFSQCIDSDGIITTPTPTPTPTVPCPPPTPTSPTPTGTGVPCPTPTPTRTATPSPSATPTPTPTPTPTVTPTLTATATPSPTPTTTPPADDDGDGWSNAAEAIIGTDPLQACGTDAWPADINNDGSVDIIGDVSRVTAEFGKSVPPAPARYDIAPDPPDQFIDVIRDIVRLTGLFGQTCTP